MSDDKNQIDKRTKENYNVAENGVFFCQPCWTAWDDEGEESQCPDCGEVRIKVHHIYKALVSRTDETFEKIGQAIAHRNRTAMSDKQKARVRLNPVKHGRYMLVSGVFPAKRGKYPDCDTCSIYDQCGPGGYCATKTNKLEKFRLRFLAAYKNGDVESLDDYAGLIQADQYAVLKDMFDDLFTRGPVLEEIVVNTNKDGVSEPVEIVGDDGKVQQLKKVHAHPVLNHIPKFMESLGMTADQRKMTQKAKGQITGDNLEDAIRDILGIRSSDDEKALNDAGLDIDFSVDDENQSEETVS